MGHVRQNGLWLAFLGALACAAGCLDLGDTSAERDAAVKDSGKNVDGAAGWPGMACDAGLEACSGTCADLTSDPTNCGACGTVCSAPTPTCLAGQCTGCGAGETMCSGTCVDVTGDPNNCGTCGTVCAAPTGSCWNGACECGLDAICDGVCVSLSSNKNNCGACGNKCPSGYGCHGGTCCQGC
jgi:hypothetical protein